MIQGQVLDLGRIEMGQEREQGSNDDLHALHLGSKLLVTFYIENAKALQLTVTFESLIPLIDIGGELVVTKVKQLK